MSRTHSWPCWRGHKPMVAVASLQLSRTPGMSGFGAPFGLVWRNFSASAIAFFVSAFQWSSWVWRWAIIALWLSAAAFFISLHALRRSVGVCLALASFLIFFSVASPGARTRLPDAMMVQVSSQELFSCWWSMPAGSSVTEGRLTTTSEHSMV